MASAPWVSLSAIATMSLLVGSAASAAPPAGTAGGKSYDTAAENAVHTHEVATLLAPFVDQCDGEAREIDRARCRGVLAYLRRTLPEQTFVLDSEDPAAITVSEYDAGVRGYHLSLAGCIACTKPVPVGRTADPRFVTVKVPDKKGDSLVKAVAGSHGTCGFDSLGEARQWLENE